MIGRCYLARSWRLSHHRRALDESGLAKGRIPSDHLLKLGFVNSTVHTVGRNPCLIRSMIPQRVQPGREVPSHSTLADRLSVTHQIDAKGRRDLRLLPLRHAPRFHSCTITWSPEEVIPVSHVQLADP